jgi:hypothetical protein
LAVAIASGVPRFRSLIQTDAYELAGIDTVEMVLKNNEVVEIRADFAANPLLFRSPLIAVVADVDALRAIA